MKSREDVEKLEKLLGQINGIYSEISALSKKSPNDGVNNFKLNLINKVLAFANDVLGPSYRPFDDFSQFDVDDLPTTSDVTVVISQYMEEAERYRSDNVVLDRGWKYVIDGHASNIEASPPARIKIR